MITSRTQRMTGIAEFMTFMHMMCNQRSGRSLKGLLIELQYRTIFQHAWATCVEIVGFLTVNQPKFGRGDVRFSRVLRLAE